MPDFDQLIAFTKQICHVHSFAILIRRAYFGTQKCRKYANKGSSKQVC